MPDNAFSPDDRLEELKNGTRQYVEGSNGNGDRCTMELLVPRRIVNDLSDEQVYQFIRTEGVDTLMKAYLAAKAITIPRGISGEISCHVDNAGAGCKGTIRF